MGAIRNYRQIKDGNRETVAFSTAGGGYVDARVLAANTAEVHTVPTGANYVLVTVTGNTWVNVGAAAAVASADVTNGAGSVLVVNTLPRMFALNGAATVGIIAPAIQTACLEFYS